MPDYSDLASLMAGGRRGSPYDSKRRFAEQMLQMGADASPIQHPLQGAARLAQALVGGWMANKADSEEKDAREQLSQKIADAGKIVDPQERIAAYTAIDPQIGMRAGSQFAVEQAKIKAQNERLGAAADGFGSSYGLPPQGGQIQRAPLPAPGQDPAANAIAGIESGGRYDAVGPVANKQGNRAYGKYQVLDTNIGPWTQEVLGRPMTPQEFLANPQAQDAVFKAKFGQYQQQYGPEGAARAWFAGEGGMNNPNAADVNGMTVQRYGQKFAQAMPPQPGQAQPAPPVTVQATPPGQPQPLTVNMRGPGGIPQGSADGAMPPMQGAPPPPQAPGGMPAVMAQAPAIPDVPRPQPTPQQIRRAQDQILAGTPRAQAEAAMNAEIDRDWGVARDRAKMQFQQQTTDFADQRRTQREIEKDDRNRNQPSRQELEKLHTARTEAATIASALNDFQREFQNTGTWGAVKSVAGATTPVNTAYNAAALMAKGEALFNLGVLNGPDLDIIRRTLPDPSTMKGATTSNQDMSAAVGKVIDLLQTRLASREKQLGLPVTDVRGAANELRATMPGGPSPQPSNGPIAPGAIEEGYRFKGGNPADKNNWERVQ